MPRTSGSEASDEKERIIVIREDAVYNYEHVIDKICGYKQPKIDLLLRIKPFENGIYRIRDERTKKLTPEKIEIFSNKKVLWIQLTNDQAKAILGTDKAPLFGTYLRDLKQYLKRHEHAYQNHPIMFLHNIRYITRPQQDSLW
jgi:hypothetical protein